jgi:hypothetical protein
MDDKWFDFHHSDVYSAFLSGLSSNIPNTAKETSSGCAGATENGGNT